MNAIAPTKLLKGVDFLKSQIKSKNGIYMYM